VGRSRCKNRIEKFRSEGIGTESFEEFHACEIPEKKYMKQKNMEKKQQDKM